MERDDKTDHDDETDCVDWSDNYDETGLGISATPFSHSRCRANGSAL